MKKIKPILNLLIIVLVLWVVITNIIMTFKNPEMTQTQLFLHLPKTVLLNFEV